MSKLQSYLRSQTRAGYSKSSLKKWLTTYGYDPSFIQKQFKQFTITQRILFCIPLLFFVVLCSFLFTSTPATTGYTVYETQQSHNLAIDLLYVEDSSYLLNLEKHVNSLKATGSGLGTIRIEDQIVYQNIPITTNQTDHLTLAYSKQWGPYGYDQEVIGIEGVTDYNSEYSCIEWQTTSSEKIEQWCTGSIACCNFIERTQKTANLSETIFINEHILGDDHGSLSARAHFFQLDPLLFKSSEWISLALHFNEPTFDLSCIDTCNQEFTEGNHEITIEPLDQISLQSLTYETKTTKQTLGFAPLPNITAPATLDLSAYIDATDFSFSYQQFNGLSIAFENNLAHISAQPGIYYTYLIAQNENESYVSNIFSIRSYGLQPSGQTISSNVSNLTTFAALLQGSSYNEVPIHYWQTGYIVAQYTNASETILNSTDISCYVSFSDNTTQQEMYFDTNIFLWNRTFSQGITTYNVSCNSTAGYPQINTTENVTIYGDEQLAFSTSSDSLSNSFESAIIAREIDNTTEILHSGRQHPFYVYTKNTTLQNTHNLTALGQSALGAADIDNDGSIDLIAYGTTGIDQSDAAAHRYVRNSSLQYHQTNTTFGLVLGSLVFIDYNNDGLIDYAVCGRNENSQAQTQLWKNTGGNFTLDTQQENFTNVYRCSLSTLDYNLDGYDDLVLFGQNDSGKAILYQNNNGIFSEQQILQGVDEARSIVFDHNHDGYTDLIYTGQNDTGPITLVYQNNGSELFLSQELKGIADGALAFSDFDNDGWIDLFLSGTNTSSEKSIYLYSNQQGNFTLDTSGYDFTGVSSGSAVSIDYDQDLDLDIIVSGTDNDFLSGAQTDIYLSNYSDVRAITQPQPPQAFSSQLQGSLLNLTWQNGSDSETNSSALYYHLRVSSTPHEDDILSSHLALSSNAMQGQLGNVGQRLFKTINVSENKTYFWQVQTIDPTLSRSSWSSLQSYDPCQNLSAINVSCYKYELSLDQNDTSLLGRNLTLHNTNLTTNHLNISALLITKNARIEGNLSIYGSLNATESNFTTLTTIATSYNNITDSSLSELNITNSQNTRLINTTYETLTFSNGSAHIAWKVTVQLNTTAVDATITAQDKEGSQQTIITDQGYAYLILNEKTINDTDTTLLTNYTFTITAPQYSTQTIRQNLTSNLHLLINLSLSDAPIYSDYDNALTTNFSSLSEWTNISNASIGLPGSGLISFTDSIDVSGLNSNPTLNDVLTIGEQYIYIDSVAAPGLNANATLTFFNLSFEKTPTILKDQGICPDCLFNSYTGSNISYNVTGFSNYSIHANAKLSIAAMNNYSSKLLVGEPIILVANYTNITTNQSIAGNCSVEVNNTLSYMNDTGVSFEFVTDFSTAQSEAMTINCSSDTYENLSTSTTFTISLNGTVLQLDESQSLTGVFFSSLLISDINNDSIADLLLAGQTGVNSQILQTYFGNGSHFNLNTTIANGIKTGSLALLDFDRDSQVDLFISGDSSSTDIARLYKNNQGEFSLNQSLEGVDGSSSASLDFDRDGYRDLILSGRIGGSSIVTRLIRNEQKRLGTNQSLDGIYQGSIAILEENESTIALFGDNSESILLASTYRNPEAYTAQQSLNASYINTLSVGDINSDGYTDLFVSGCSERSLGSCTSNLAEVYLFNGTDYELNAPYAQNITPTRYGSSALGDYDNDGDLDLALVGKTATDDLVATIYENNGSAFIEDLIASSNLTGIQYASVAWHDIDQDNDLDLIVSGTSNSGSSGKLAQVYLNDVTTANTAPNPPNTTNISYSNSQLHLRWNNATDNETLNASLSYQIRVGSALYTDDIVSEHLPFSSNPTQGHLGNMQHQHNTSLNIIEQCSIFQVRAIDSVHALSAWSEPINHSTTEICDGVDNDCDSTYNGSLFNSSVDEGFDNDLDGYFPYNGSLNGSSFSCSGYESFDCDDSDASSYPGASCGRGGSLQWSDSLLDCVCTGESSVGFSVGASGGGGSGGGSAAALAKKTEKREQKKSAIESEQQQTQEAQAPVEQASPPPSGSSSESAQVVKKVLSENDLRHERIFEYSSSSKRTQITETLKNAGLFTETEITIYVIIPKEVAEHASLIISEDEFVVIEEDPEIEFIIGSLAPGATKTIQYSVPGEVTQTDLIESIVNKKEKDQEELQEEAAQLQEKIEKTEQAVEVNTSYEIDYQNNETIFNIDLDLRENTTRAENLSIIMEIPKCMIEYLEGEELTESNFKFDIQNPDPVIIWHLENLIGREKIHFALKTVADEQCTNQARVLAVARDILFLEKGYDKTKVIITLLITLLIFSILLYFSKFTSEVEHESEVSRDLIKYVRRMFHLGYKEDQIAHVLQRQGFSPNQIHQVMSLNAKHILHYWILRLGITGEELIFIFIGMLHLLNFLDIIPGDLDFVKKIISWTLMALIFYSVSITRVLFGYRWSTSTGFIRKFRIDIIILFAFFALLIKQLISFARVGAESHAFVYDFYNFLINHALVIEQTGFIIGISLLFLLSAIVAMRKEIVKPSFLSVFGMVGKSTNLFHILFRTVCINILLLFFYYIVFEKMTEWLAIAIDAPLFILSIPIALYIIYKHSHKMQRSARALTAKVATFLDKYYENFVELFHYKKTVVLGMVGILLLHLLTEVLIFIIPYVTSRFDPIYFGNFNQDHSPLFFDRIKEGEIITKSLLSVSLGSLPQGILGSSAIFLTYLLNVIGFIGFAFIIGYLWIMLAKHRNKPFTAITHFIADRRITAALPLITAGFVIFLLNPAFILETIVGDNIVGVDIQSAPISLTDLYPLLIIALGAGFLVWVCQRIAKTLSLRLLLSGYLLYFMYYIQLYYSGIYQYFEVAVSIANPLLSIYFWLFRLFSMVFYIGGSIAFFILSIGAIWNLRHPLLEELFHLNLHAIHHHQSHEELVHGEKKQVLVENIISNMAHGHELFIVAEHLMHHGWPTKLITEAIVAAKSDPRWEFAESKINHTHHNKKAIKTLHMWIQKEMRYKHSIDHIINRALHLGYSEDDIVLAFKHIKLKGRFRSLQEEETLFTQERGISLKDEIQEIIDEYKEQGITPKHARILLKHAEFSNREIEHIVSEL